MNGSGQKMQSNGTNVESRARRRGGQLLLLLVIVLATATSLPSQDQKPPDDAVPSPAAPTTSAAPERVSRLQGTAYLARNQDVVGATVVVHSMKDSSTIYLTSTDEKGGFKIDGLPDGEYKVRVERHGVEAMIKNNVSVRFPFRAVVELDMKQVEHGPVMPVRAEHEGPDASGSFRLSGTTKTPRGLPMAEVKVRLVRSDGTADPRMATSSADGTFEIEGLPAGEWMVTVIGVGMLPIRTTLYLEHDQRLEIKLTLQPASYVPSPLELMPPEEPIPPSGLAGDTSEG